VPNIICHFLQPQLSHMPQALLHVDFHHLDKHLLRFAATVFTIYLGSNIGHNVLDRSSPSIWEAILVTMFLIVSACNFDLEYGEFRNKSRRTILVLFLHRWNKHKLGTIRIKNSLE
jgi:hypothetical protein